MNASPHILPVVLVMALLTALISLALVLILARYARSSGMLDLPGTRQSHSQPTPTGAGAGMVAALVMGSVLTNLLMPLAREWMVVVLPASVLLSALGWLDDRRGVSAAIRLAVQVLVSFALLALLSVGLVSLSWWSWLLYALALVGVMNAYNFMDGSNGMAGFQGAFAGLLLAGLYWQAAAPELAVPALLLAAACLGFLPVNFPLARVFMGDSGSVPLGFGLAALIGLGINQGVLSLPVGLMVLGVFLVDSSLTLLKRVFQGERWYTAHKQHVYQRLIAQGWPHSRVLLLYQAINMFLVAPVILLARMYPNLAWTLAGVVFLLLTTGWYLASLRLEVRN
jgi:Fuc2NAc and GlcNAc transferase